MADLGQMDANLVGSARLQPACHQAGGSTKAFQDLEVGYGRNALLAVAGNAAAAVAPVGHQGQVDPALRVRNTPSTTARYVRSMECSRKIA